MKLDHRHLLAVIMLRTWTKLMASYLTVGLEV